MKEKNYFKIDGVFRDCMVWLNGHFLGRNFSGYSEFNFDVSDYLNYGSKNILVIRVDATQPEGWFYRRGRNLPACMAF